VPLDVGIDQVVGPAVERVRPEFALSNREPLLPLQIIAELSEGADDVLLAHLVEDRLEAGVVATLKIRRHVIHDDRDDVAPLHLLLREPFEDLRRRFRWSR